MDFAKVNDVEAAMAETDAVRINHKAHPQLTQEHFKQLANRERVERCWKCRSWEPKLRNLGECRVNPPTRNEAGSENGSFPLTHFLMWCGRFIQS